VLLRLRDETACGIDSARPWKIPTFLALKSSLTLLPV
jgi:hypothetical protein